MSSTIRTPLRYPGGKSKVVRQLVRHSPPEFSEFREPFVGGGSMFIYLKHHYPHLKLWINDLNPELFYFWVMVQQDLPKLVQRVAEIKTRCIDGRQLFEDLTQRNTAQMTSLDRAVRFFVLNRITFSGTVESGGYSQQAFQKRFTPSSIQRLANLNNILDNAIITCQDYETVVTDAGQSVFIFLDPPYFAATKSKLYGKKGDLHTAFDHDRFANVLQHCPHSWLITYDNSPEIYANFSFDQAHIQEWELQYGMNNYKQAIAAKGKELLIANYPLAVDS
jgi:DNA adenine methylase